MGVLRFPLLLAFHFLVNLSNEHENFDVTLYEVRKLAL
jgi:hypothetical protein